MSKETVAAVLKSWVANVDDQEESGILPSVREREEAMH
jgi:hypothetical protein